MFGTNTHQWVKSIPGKQRKTQVKSKKTSKSNAGILINHLAAPNHLNLQKPKTKREPQTSQKQQKQTKSLNHVIKNTTNNKKKTHPYQIRSQERSCTSAKPPYCDLSAPPNSSCRRRRREPRRLNVLGIEPLARGFFRP